MHWKALLLLVIAALLSAPLMGDTTCAAPSCCAQMTACCGHCHCPAEQSCSAARPSAIDQQAPLRVAQVSPRVSVELFTLAMSIVPSWSSESRPVWSQPEPPPPKASQPRQARLCLWLV